MFRLLKYLSIFFLTIILLCLTTWIVFKGELATFITSKFAKETQKNNLFLNFSGPDFGLLSFKTKQLAIEIPDPKKPINFTVHNLKIAPVITSLFSNNQAIRINFDVLDGDVSGKIVRNGKTLEIHDLNLEQIKIYQLPFLRMFGFSSGDFSLVLNRLSFDSQNPQIEDLNFEFKNLNKKEASVIPRWISGLPMDINIPPLHISQLTGKATLQKNIKLDDLQVDSDWLQLKGKLELGLVGNKGVQIVHAAGEAKIEEAGKSFQPFLILFSNQQLTVNDHKFQFQFLDYQSGLPRFNFKPLP